MTHQLAVVLNFKWELGFSKTNSFNPDFNKELARKEEEEPVQ
jgi:hypothetical protein